MIEWTDELKKQFRTVQIIAFAMLIGAPIAYIFAAYQLNKELISGGEFDIMFYMLFSISMIQPVITPLIEKYQISIFKKNPNSKFVNVSEQRGIFTSKPEQGTPMGLYTIVIIIKCAIVEAIFLYGMVLYFVSGDMTRMLYFYPIGIAWTIVYFPTKAKCLKFLEKVSTNEPV